MKSVLQYAQLSFFLNKAYGILPIVLSFVSTFVAKYGFSYNVYTKCIFIVKAIDKQDYWKQLVCAIEIEKTFHQSVVCY